MLLPYCAGLAVSLNGKSFSLTGLVLQLSDCISVTNQVKQGVGNKPAQPFLFLEASSI